MRLRFLYRAFKARYRDQRHELRAVRTLIQRGDTVVDIGANKGAYLYWLQKAVGADGKVFAFEPQPALFCYLQQIAATMKWHNVHLGDCALSDSAGKRRLFVPGESVSPGASLETAATTSVSGHSYDCQTDTLDHQLATALRVSFLKMDVEGHELNVFRGAVKTLSRHAPVILFECEARHLQDHLMQDVFAFLHGLEYVGAFFSPTGLQPLAEFDARLHQKPTGERFWDAPGYCNNFLFAPRAKSECLCGTHRH
jgi:FkbM family methyltransferase